jgi:hypothetical protein
MRKPNAFGGKTVDVRCDFRCGTTKTPWGVPVHIVWDNQQNVRPHLRRRHLLSQHAVGLGKAAHASTQNFEEMSS